MARPGRPNEIIGRTERDNVVVHRRGARARVRKVPNVTRRTLRGQPIDLHLLIAASAQSFAPRPRSARGMHLQMHPVHRNSGSHVVSRRIGVRRMPA
ncbi:hypothetical protein A8H40_00925 [Burkholderia multivorans]|uniref:Uncharacterized protein n=1 Tax=Burkholderia multivorans CGD2 TaxID=513052 RepID=B9BLC5_9BURK|nr:hypothetical protein A8H40_00925 [Burkholderia multivorans]EEE08742.1 hypothetical protein BURMUCGD2_5883 [Burkholderia multivorans CGD2]EJO62099.1 hypothetical protein BURMUCF1_A1846 [Burkholderia multivorans ATCC BAA-247]PRE13454.1 hypothetical protein C6P92_19060 [Burkholderia multivorans]PRE30933.1 hypothetical protein C6P79_05675 [Burkholderia multivorans]